MAETFNISGQGGDQFNISGNTFSSAGGGFGGSFSEGQIIRAKNGPTQTNRFYVVKDGQLFGLTNLSDKQVQNLQTRAQSQGIQIPEVQDNVIGDFFSARRSQGKQGYGGSLGSTDELFSALASDNPNVGLEGTPGDPKSDIFKREQGTLPQQQFSGGQFLGQQTRQASTVGAPQFSQALQPGSRGDEVKKLQDYLVSQGLMTQEQVNTGPGIYGPQTTAAVKKLQEGIGVDNTGGVGFFGPKTIAAVQSQTAQQSIGSTVPSAIGVGDTTPEEKLPYQLTSVPEFNEILKGVYEYFKTIIASGQTIPVNVEISPELAERFLEDAKREIAPYYSSKILAIQDNLTKNFDTLQQQFELGKQNEAAKFKESVGATRESAAGRGTTFSGAAARDERSLQDLQNRNLESGALSLESQIGNTLRSTEQQIGSQNLAGLGIPTFNSGRASLAGQGGIDTSGTVLKNQDGTYRGLNFAPTGNILGTIEQEQSEKAQIREKVFEKDEIQRRQIKANAERKLNFT